MMMIIPPPSLSPLLVDYLHSLVERSAGFERQVKRKATLLLEAQEEVQELRARVIQEKPTSKDEE